MIAKTNWLGIKKDFSVKRSLSCGAEWARTTDSRIFSPMLYQLSYITEMRVQMYTKNQMTQKILKKKQLFSTSSKIADAFFLSLRWNSIILFENVFSNWLGSENIHPSQEN